MRQMVRWLVVVALFAGWTGAEADTFQTFNLSGTLQSGGTALGTIVVDESTGFVTSANVTVSADNSTFLFTGVPAFENATGCSPMCDAEYAYFLYVTQNVVTGTDLNLVLPLPLVGYAGGNLCTINTPCANVGNGSSFSDSFGGVPPTDYFTTLTASATPEPAGWVGVVTGLVGMAGRLRRRERTVCG